MNVSNKVLILFAHPALHKSRINIKLSETVKDINGVTFHNLYDTYPDFHIDVKHEQQLLVQHNVIIWQHPFYWYSAPSILKEWIDLVLEHNFAYGSKGNALKGKKVMTVITAGGRRDAYKPEGYNRFSIMHLLAPFEQTANLCKMIYLSPFVIHGTHLLSEEEITEHAENYKKAIISLRDNIFELDEIKEQVYFNDLLT